ncbi:MAG: methylmalonyl Co-A mutase-associated GTPase MeaB [Limisphaerales bacterium]
MNTLSSETSPTPGKNPTPRTALTVDDYVKGVLAGNRTILARAITLLESSSTLHEPLAQEVLRRVLPESGKAKRIGITGVPGVGKSTFIESFGSMLAGRGHKIAVLTIDPSSSRSGGSILGDKTRMQKLSREPNASIRPSPASHNLGGVARRTREAMLLCEAAGFDIVLVETVGVGQSETALRSMVDFFLLLQLPGAGDELQAMKKGIVEMADLILVNKADGDNRSRAELARAEQEIMVHYLESASPEWKTQIALSSGLTGDGIPQAWEIIEKFYRELEPKGVIARRRQQQSIDWLTDLIADELHRKFYQHPAVAEQLATVKGALLRGELTAMQGAKKLLSAFSGEK